MIGGNDGGERRLDKYDIPVEVSGKGAPPPADGFAAQVKACSRPLPLSSSFSVGCSVFLRR
jgi:hypothetical protein